MHSWKPQFTGVNKWTEQQPVFNGKEIKFYSSYRETDSGPERSHPENWSVQFGRCHWFRTLVCTHTAIHCIHNRMMNSMKTKYFDWSVFMIHLHDIDSWSRWMLIRFYFRLLKSKDICDIRWMNAAAINGYLMHLTSFLLVNKQNWLMGSGYHWLDSFFFCPLITQIFRRIIKFDQKL